MKKKVVVFGATGNLGAYIAVHLNEQGYDVIAVGHRKSDNDFFKDRGMSYYSVNIEDPKAFNVLPKEDIYAVAHFASSLPSRSLQGHIIYMGNMSLVLSLIIMQSISVINVQRNLIFIFLYSSTIDEYTGLYSLSTIFGLITLVLHKGQTFSDFFNFTPQLTQYDITYLLLLSIKTGIFISTNLVKNILSNSVSFIFLENVI